MELLISWITASLVILVVAYVLPGITLTGFIPALMTALVLGIVNAFIKPLLVILTLPINVLTLGLFTLVINALLVMLVSAAVPGFKVDGFWPALFFSLGLSVTNWILSVIFS